MQRLIAAGLNDCAIARQTGIPRPTVWGWRRRPQVRSRDSCVSPCNAHDFSSLPAKPYCYLLGLYLGDGCVSRHQRAWCLRVTLDEKYPEIIDRCREAIDTLMPGQHASIAATDRMRRRLALLEALAVPAPSAWSGPEAPKGQFGWSPGRKCSSNRPPRNSFAA